MFNDTSYNIKFVQRKIQLWSNQIGIDIDTYLISLLLVVYHFGSEKEHPLDLNPSTILLYNQKIPTVLFDGVGCTESYCLYVRKCQDLWFQVLIPILRFSFHSGLGTREVSESHLRRERRWIEDPRRSLGAKGTEHRNSKMRDRDSSHQKKEHRDRGLEGEFLWSVI